MTVGLIIAGIIIVVIALILMRRMGRTDSSMDTFRRRIDALSPEARQTVLRHRTNADDTTDGTVNDDGA